MTPSSSWVASRCERSSTSTMRRRHHFGPVSRAATPHHDFRDVLAAQGHRRRGRRRPRSLARPHDRAGRRSGQGHLLRETAVALHFPGTEDDRGSPPAQADPPDAAASSAPAPTIRFACELVRNGRIGKVQRVLTFIAPQNAVDPGPGWKPMPVPEGFDYDFWLGPAPSSALPRGTAASTDSASILDYSGGQTTNFGAHSNDIAQWGLGTDDTGPVELEDLGSEWPPEGEPLHDGHQGRFPRPLRQRRGTDL